jgi:hypothetical protein
MVLLRNRGTESHSLSGSVQLGIGVENQPLSLPKSFISVKSQRESLTENLSLTALVALLPDRHIFLSFFLDSVRLLIQSKLRSELKGS